MTTPAPIVPGQTPQSNPSVSHTYDDISANRASVLLRLGLPSPRNAADDLVDRLEAHGGAEWARAVMAREPFTGAGLDIASIVGGIPLTTLVLLKDRGKDMVKSPIDRDGYLAGLAGYYLAIAAAICHHHSIITRTPKADLSQILIEIASVAPPDWSRLFVTAAKGM